MGRRFLFIQMLLVVAAFTFAQGNSDEDTGLRLFYEQSYSRALLYLQRAAKESSLKALDCLGQMYADGLGVEKSETIMMNMYNRAIQEGYAPSMVSLGFYYLGNDNEKAVKWWKKAAQLKYGPAYTLLGDYYKHGFGDSIDLNQAVIAYSCAADCGEKRAYSNLGSVFEMLDEKRKAYEQYMKAYQNSVLTEKALVALVDMLCDKSALYYSKNYDENVVKAGEILNSVQGYPDKVNELKQKYERILWDSAQKVKYAEQKEQQYNELLRICISPEIAYPEVATLPSGRKVNFVNIPYHQKKALGTNGIFGSSFTISFFMKSMGIGANGGCLFYGYNDYVGSDINKQNYPIASIANKLLTLRMGKENYEFHAFKQFADTEKNIFDGQWHHIVLTYSKAIKKAEIYIDGCWKGNEFFIDIKELQFMKLVFCAGLYDLRIGDLCYFKNKALDGNEIDIFYSHNYK